MTFESQYRFANISATWVVLLIRRLNFLLEILLACQDLDKSRAQLKGILKLLCKYWPKRLPSGHNYVFLRLFLSILIIAYYNNRQIGSAIIKFHTCVKYFSKTASLSSTPEQMLQSPDQIKERLEFQINADQGQTDDRYNWYRYIGIDMIFIQENWYR